MTLEADHPLRCIVHDVDGNPVSPATVLEAYAQRCFPMADHRHGPFAWFRPSERAVITWESWKVPRSLAKTWRRHPYRLTCDTAFDAVIEACADRSETWINHDIDTLYRALHRLGIAHSIEAWDHRDRLVGGCYGLALGGCFCGESMFHRAADAAKLAVVQLVRHLRAGGFQLLDCQQQTPHMARFEAQEISDARYADLLRPLLDEVPEWPAILDAGHGPLP
jgi:leucyl/phenylalanyl-tRNA--protein transferase